MSSSYTPFDLTHPVGSQTGPGLVIGANTNDVALWYAIVQGGAMPGFTLSQFVGSGTAEQPEYQQWTNGSQAVRAHNTWGTSGGQAGNLTQQVWEVTQDGTTWATICTQTFTYDSSGNNTATTGAGGFASWLGYLLGKVKTLLAAFNTHASGTGAAVHGLGTIVSQEYYAVALTGGTINGVTIGGSTPAAAAFTRATEGINTLQTPGSGAGVALDWSKGNSRVTNSGTNAITFTNVAATGLAAHMVYVSNFNACTWPASLPNGNWGAAGKPSFATPAWVSLWSPDAGTTVYGSIAWK